MQLQGSFQQGRFRLDAVGVGQTTLYGADGLTGFGLVERYAFGAELWVNYIDVVAFRNSVIGAFRFARTTVDTVMSDYCRHGLDS